MTPRDPSAGARLTADQRREVYDDYCGAVLTQMFLREGRINALADSFGVSEYQIRQALKMERRRRHALPVNQQRIAR